MAMVPAPPTFSITTVWPSPPRILSAMMRAAASADPPRGDGTISVTGFDGKPCAAATLASRAAAMPRRILVICLPPDRRSEALQRQRAEPAAEETAAVGRNNPGGEERRASRLRYPRGVERERRL